MKYTYRLQGVCGDWISFDFNVDRITDIAFTGGCNGNLKAISKLVDGMSVDDIEAKLLGNTCGFKQTSCADQLAKAVRQAYEEMKAEG